MWKFFRYRDVAIVEEGIGKIAKLIDVFFYRGPEDADRRLNPRGKFPDSGAARPAGQQPTGTHDDA